MDIEDYRKSNVIKIQKIFRGYFTRSRNLPLILQYCQKYLKLFNYNNVEFISTEEIDNIEFETKEYDLIISNWCLSEFDNDGIEFYIEKIIKHVKKGYFLMNIWDEPRKNFLIDTISKYFSTVKVESESTKTNINQNFLLYVKK